MWIAEVVVTGYGYCGGRGEQAFGTGDLMAMVLNPRDDVTVEVASGDEIDATIQRELDVLGLTYDELAAQAEDDEFASEDARRLWFMISPIGS